MDCERADIMKSGYNVKNNVRMFHLVTNRSFVGDNTQTVNE